MPPAHRLTHPVNGSIGAIPHEGEAAPRAQHAGDLGNGTFLVHPVPGGRRDDHVVGSTVGGELLGLAGADVDAGRRLPQHGAHALVGLDRRHVADPFG